MLLEKVKQTISSYNMLEPGDKVLVGVSGGPDSMALLHILNRLGKEFNLGLFAAHLNHMVRKKEADEDALFVMREAEKLNISFLAEAKDVPRIAREQRLSIEEAGRAARYDFYNRAAKEFNANKIALGHTADDQAETVLMRLLRGSGLLGLSGIPPTRQLGDAVVIRPLIEISKSEIIKFLKIINIPFRKDSTNAQPKYLRNRVRQRLLPFLEKEFSPEVRATLKDIGKNLRIDYNYILGVSEKKVARYTRCAKGLARVSLKFLAEDLAIQRMIIREAIKKVKGDLNCVTYSHWEDVNNLLGRKAGRPLTLPGGILVKKTKDDLVFYKKAPEKQVDLKSVFYRLETPGETRIAEINKRIETSLIKKAPSFKTKKCRSEEYFDFEKLRQPLSVRFRKSFDKIRPLGMTKFKRVKQLFIDEKVDLEKRDKVPFVISKGKIIWICGVKRSDEAKVTGRTTKVLRLKIV